MFRLIGTILTLILTVGAAAGQPATDLLTLESGSSVCRLSRPGIVDGSEWVYMGLSRAVRGLDYTIDYKTGAITTTKPVSSRTPVRVDYTYSPLPTGGGVPPDGLASSGTRGLALIPVYQSGKIDHVLGKQSGTITYGVDSLITLGGDSTLSGAWYMSGPQGSGLTGGRSAVLPNVDRPVREGKAGSLIEQNADIGLGIARLRVGCESVGQDFQGSSNSTAARQAIEKERGIKRIDVAGMIPAGVGDLSFSSNRVLDKQGEISSSNIGFSRNGFAFSYGVREVSKDFKGFGRIREADASQMAAEAGLTRSLLGVRYGRSGIGSGSFSLSTLNGEGGGITTTGALVESGQFRFTYDARVGNAGFGRPDALNDQERSAMALAIRRQFSRTVSEKDVTARDKRQFNREAGLNRKNYLLEWRGTGFGAWLGRSSVTNAVDGLGRIWLGLQGKTFSLDWTRQSVGSGFDRLSSLQPVEMAAYGSERGTTRKSLTGSINFSGASAAFAGTAVSYGSTSIAQGSMDVKGPGLSFHAGYRVANPAYDRLLTTHLESAAGKGISIVLDTIDAGSSDGRKETARSLSFHSKTGGGLGVSGLAQIIGDAAGKSGVFGAIGLDWAINKDLVLRLNLENVGRGTNAGRRNRQFSLNGLLAKRLLILHDIKISSGLNTASLNGERIGCDNSLKIEAGLLGGNVVYASGDKLDSSGDHIRRTSRLFTYKTDQSPSRTCRFACSIRTDATLSGESVTKREFSADTKLWRGGSVTCSGSTGGGITRGGAMPARACEIKINHRISGTTNVLAHYASSVNCLGKRGTRSLGLGVSGKLPNAEYALEVGRALVDDGSSSNSGGELRIRYEHRFSESNYITFNAAKTVRPGKTDSKDTDPGNSARIDLRMEF